MTPNEALAEAITQFHVLYVNDPDKLQAILKRALGVYQDRAGVIKTITTADADISVLIPADMLSVIHCSDKNSRYHDVIQSDTTLTADVDVESVYPYTFWYFVNLRDFDLEEDLPAGMVGTLIDYLVAVIDIQNTERARAVALSTGRQTELPTNSEMLERKAIVETYMEDNRAIIPMLSVF